jgi:Secretion system C-terminal sorting domain
MKKITLLILLFVGITSTNSFAQTLTDTLAIQDFDSVPATPTWGYTGVLSDLQSGFASPTSCIPNTPLGINGSQAWHVVSVSAGNAITFDNIVIPPSYDTVRVSFKLAGLNLNASTGGPDNLDYVLVEYSLDSGLTWVPRLRVRGASVNNCFWAYDATGIAAVQHLPASETMFQASTVGLQVAEGYSFCEISFPGSSTAIALRITPRSSSLGDSWLIDNLIITGEYECTPTASSISEVSCASYVSPSGSVYTTSGTYLDTITNAGGCDSIITINLTINTVDVSVTQNGISLTADLAGAIYQWVDCGNSYAVISGETNQSFTPTVNGDYAVIVDDGVCMDTSICYNINGVGIGENENISLVHIYPNPTTGKITIECEGMERVEVLDVAGKLIYEIASSLSPRNDVVEIDLSGFSKGVYFVRVSSEDGVAVERVVLE